MSKVSSTQDIDVSASADYLKEECLACHSKNKQVVFREFGIPILRCKACGHVTSTFVSDQHYDQYFAHEITDDEVYWWDESHCKMYEAFGARFLAKREGRLLDIGAGLGYFVKFVSAYAGWDASGYEISSPAVAYGRQVLGLENKLFAGAVEDSGFVASSFDLVTLWDVLEHIPNPDILLSYILHIVKPGGTLFVATPNAPMQVLKAKLKVRMSGMHNDEHYLEAKDHLNLYTPTSLRMVLRRVGFADISFTHIPPIQSAAGSRSTVLRLLKNGWYVSAKLASAIAGQNINVNNNLFAIARKG